MLQHGPGEYLSSTPEGTTGGEAGGTGHSRSAANTATRHRTWSATRCQRAGKQSVTRETFKSEEKKKKKKKKNPQKTSRLYVFPEKCTASVSQLSLGFRFEPVSPGQKNPSVRLCCLPNVHELSWRSKGCHSLKCRVSSLLLFPTFWDFSYFFLLFHKIPTFSYFLALEGKISSYFL